MSTKKSSTVWGLSFRNADVDRSCNRGSGPARHRCWDRSCERVVFGRICARVNAVEQRRLRPLADLDTRSELHLEKPLLK